MKRRLFIARGLDPYGQAYSFLLWAVDLSTAQKRALNSVDWGGYYGPPVVEEVKE